MGGGGRCTCVSGWGGGGVRAVSSVSEEVIGGSDAGRQCWGGVGRGRWGGEEDARA